MPAKEILDITINVSAPYVQRGLVGGDLRPQGIRRDYTATVDGTEFRNTRKDTIQSVIRARVHRTHGSNVRVRFTFVGEAS